MTTRLNYAQGRFIRGIQMKAAGMPDHVLIQVDVLGSLLDCAHAANRDETPSKEVMEHLNGEDNGD